MYDPRKLYYLQQLGIRPWVGVAQSMPNKLIVLMNATMSIKAQALAKRFLSMLQIPADEIDIIQIENNDINTQLKNKNPWLVLSLGIQAKDLETSNITCPIVNTYSPEFLLENPKQKKVLFKDLQGINEQIRTQKAS